MSGRISQRNVTWELVALAVGLFTLVALPVVQADAYTVSVEPTITESHSVVVHTSTPGRHVLHVDTATTVDCDACYGDDGPTVTHEISQRSAIVETVEINSLITGDVAGNLPGFASIPVGFAPELPPPRH